jgi:hypothetical protein
LKFIFFEKREYCMKIFRNTLLFCIVTLASTLPSIANAESLEQIITWGDRWINPQGGQGGGAPPSGGGGTSGRNESNEAEPAGREEERKRICVAIATALANTNCTGKATSPPTGYVDVQIPDSYSTRLAWHDTVVALALQLYNGNNVDYLAVVGNAIVAAWQRCGNSGVCVEEVSRYYGISRVSLPDAIALRDGSNIFNWLRARSGNVDNSSFLNAEGGRMGSRFTNGAVCKVLNDLKPKFRCS